MGYGWAGCVEPGHKHHMGAYLLDQLNNSHTNPM